MNLISVNINGLNDHTKQTALVDWLKCMKADVVCLQETHTPSHESARKWFANSGYHVASSSLTSKSAGVAILVKDTWKISRIIKDKQGRFIQVFIDFGENQLSFVSLYASNTNLERNRYFTSLTDLIDLSHTLFLLGAILTPFFIPKWIECEIPLTIQIALRTDVRVLLHWSRSCHIYKHTRYGVIYIQDA